MLYSKAVTIGAIIFQLAHWSTAYVLPGSGVFDHVTNPVHEPEALYLRDSRDPSDVLASKADHSRLTIGSQNLTFGNADIQKIMDAIYTICTDTGCDEGHAVDIPFGDAVGGIHHEAEAHLTVNAEGEHDNTERRGDMIKLIFKDFQAEPCCEQRKWYDQTTCCTDTHPPKCTSCTGDPHEVTHCSTSNFMQVSTWSKKGFEMGSMKVNLKSIDETPFSCKESLDHVNDAVGPFMKEAAAIFGILGLACN